jgi:tRNA-dihydrouridine synthase A
LIEVDPLIFGEAARFASPKRAAEELIPYIARELERGTRLHSIIRHLHGLFHAVPGARAYRRQLANAAATPHADAAYFAAALTLARDTVLADAAA